MVSLVAFHLVPITWQAPPPKGLWWLAAFGISVLLWTLIVALLRLLILA